MPDDRVGPKPERTRTHGRRGSHQRSTVAGVVHAEDRSPPSRPAAPCRRVGRDPRGRCARRGRGDVLAGNAGRRRCRAGRPRRGHGPRGVALLRLGLQQRSCRAAGDPRGDLARGRLLVRSHPRGAAEERAHHVLGAQCQLWTEYVPNAARAEYQYFPRLCALAERTWSPSRQDRCSSRGAPGEATRAAYAVFEQRVARHLRRLAALDVDYRPLEGPTLGQVRSWRRSSAPRRRQ